MLPRRIGFPKFLETVGCKITIYGDGLDEDTGEPVKALEWQGNCIWSEKSKQVITADKRMINLIGTAIVEGDIAPSLPAFAGGCIIIYPNTPKEKKMLIYEGKRPRNPDGTIHHTSLELI